MKEFKRKISSRKFQVAIIGILVPILALMNVDEIAQKHIIALASSTLAAIAYIFGEAYVDGKREESSRVILIKEDETLENHGGGEQSYKIKESVHE